MRRDPAPGARHRCPPRPRVAVLGAGAAGLCAARHLLGQGLEPTLLELGSCGGGLWVHENDNGRSPAYDSLHINSEARITSYPDHPFPPGTSLFPSHREVARYLRGYAERFDLVARTRFRTRVRDVRPDGEDGWLVTSDPGGAERFDGVVVATGHQAQPAHPPWADDLSAEYLHAHAYRRPGPFAGRRVLVVGVGNSALDIAADLAPVAASTTIAARSPVLIMPRMLLGVPTSRVLVRVERPWMPWPLRRAIRLGVSRLAHGRMEDWGFVTPRTRTHPAGHPTVMSHIAYGRIDVRPGVRGATEEGLVRFADGTAGDHEVVIAATGYEIDLPFLAPELAPVAERSLHAYRRVVHPDHPGLWFVGYFNASGGANIRMMDVQARWVAALATGRATLPDAAAMHAGIAEDRRAQARLYPAGARYGLELDPVAYPAQVAAELAHAA